MKKLPIAVVSITKNEAFHLPDFLDHLRGRVEEVIIVDSFSDDATLSIANERGARVIQRVFRDFGDQWNFAIAVPTDQPWTMKLDPDERVPEDLWKAIERAISENAPRNGYHMIRRLWFMGKPLHVTQKILRLWRTGKCRFTDVIVNEHPIVEGDLGTLGGFLEHLDSKDLQDWVNKQNHYSTLEAITASENRNLAANPRFFGTQFERRMWLKKNICHIPLRYQLLWIYNYFFSGAWRDGREGMAWVHLRVWVHRMKEFKTLELARKAQFLDARDLAQPE